MLLFLVYSTFPLVERRSGRGHASLLGLSFLADFERGRATVRGQRRGGREGGREGVIRKSRGKLASFRVKGSGIAIVLRTGEGPWIIGSTDPTESLSSTLAETLKTRDFDGRRVIRRLIYCRRFDVLRESLGRFELIADRSAELCPSSSRTAMKTWRVSELNISRGRRGTSEGGRYDPLSESESEAKEKAGDSLESGLFLTVRRK